ncbi:hypothetical protein Tco_1388576 [Tanacetum coccineum]
MEEEEEEEMDVDADEEWDGPKWILPYQGADPLNPPPPASDSESEIEFEEAAPMPPPPIPDDHEPEAKAAPMPPPPVPADHEPKAEAATVGTGRLVPLTRLFTNTQVWTGSSSSSAAVGHDPKDLTPSHIRSDLDALHRRVRQIEEDDVRAENNRLRMIALRVPVTHNDPRDPYIAARDAATAPATDNDDSPTQKETSPSKPQGSPPPRGQGGAIAVQECTFLGFMKCNPMVFHGHEGPIKLSRWFEKTEMVFGISECAEARKVKFAAATFQGRALTWWNS